MILVINYVERFERVHDLRCNLTWKLTVLKEKVRGYIWII